MHMKGALTDKSFAVSRKWLVPGSGGNLRVNKAPGVKTSNIDNEMTMSTQD